MKDEDEYPRIRDLPAHELEPFRRWLYHRTRPWISGVVCDEQDAFYECDYRAWKSGLPVPIDVLDLVPSPMDDLREQLRLVFSTKDAVDEWLDSPDRSFGGLSPRVVASRSDGLQCERDLIMRMIHGIP